MYLFSNSKILEDKAGGANMHKSYLVTLVLLIWSTVHQSGSLQYQPYFKSQNSLYPGSVGSAVFFSSKTYTCTRPR